MPKETYGEPKETGEKKDVLFELYGGTEVRQECYMPTETSHVPKEMYHVPKES